MDLSDPRFRTAAARAALPIVLVVTLWAGLYPFSWARKNDVRWLGAGGGLRFGPASMALSEAELSWNTSDGPAVLGFELWLAPAGPTTEAKPILVVVDEPRMPALLLSQEGVDLVVASRVTNADGERWYNDFVFPDVFAGEGVRHVALASGAPRPRLYVDGHEVGASSGYGIPLARRGMPLRGPLLLGCSPRAGGSWCGELRGLVVHDRAPTPSELAQRAGPPQDAVADAARQPGVVAAYALTEGEGTIVSDLSGKGPALRLPQYYRPVGAQLLAPIPHSSWMEPHVILDVVLNLVGFLPLGFLLALVLLRNCRVRPLLAVLLVTAAGAGVSLSIEALQVLMPSRDSSLLDFLLNTAGAALGAGFALWVAARRGVATRTTEQAL